MCQSNQQLLKLIVSTITSALLLIPQASVAITKASSVEIIHQVRNGPTANDIPISTTTKNANCKGPAVICKNYIQFGFIGETVAKAKIELPLLAAATAHKPSLTLWFQDFTEKLNVKQIKASSKNGQLPIVSWEPQKLKDKIPDNYPLNDIASGKFDKYLISSAKLAKWARVPFVIRFAHEMNGYWYPWGQPKPGDPRSLATKTNTPTQYINAYRHVHDIFQSVGAKNVIWMWSPNLIDATPTISLKSLYPGDSYVDVMGLSGYLRDPGQTYNTRFPKTLQQLSEINSTKPIIVAEMAVAKKLDRTLLIKELMRSLAHCPQIQGLLWLNKTTATHDFNILKDPVGLLVLKDELAQPRFNPTSGLRFSYVGIPAIAGSMTIGSTLAATGSYWGYPTSITYIWFSCPSATDLETDCEQIERGKYHYLNEADRHKYLHLMMVAMSPLGVDSALSAVTGPVMFIPETPIVTAVNLRATSTQLVFGSVATTATNLQVQVDNQTPIYLPTNSSEYWITGLTLGESHTYKVSFIDVFGQSKSVGTAATGTFTAAKSPDAPKLTISPTTMTVQLPTPTTGQSAWKFWTDTQQPITVNTETTTLELPVLEVGPHTFNLVNISGDGSTLTKITNFQILPAPIVTAVNLRGTSTQLVFASPPAGVSKIVIRTGEGNTTYLPATTTEYWLTKLTPSQAYSYSITYQALVGGNYFEGLAISGQFVALSTPIHATVAVDGTQITILFPAAASGQSNWRYWIDNDAFRQVLATKTSVILPNIAPGTHRVWIQAVGQDGITLSVSQPFEIVN